MELPDCPPGAEGYEDSVIEVPKKPEIEDTTCTKAELEFQEHLNSLKIKLEDGTTRCMVERRGRDISGKWIYLCYPCAAVCSGESILQTHISGKKHKVKLTMRSVWPQSIFEEHPFIQTSTKSVATEKVLQKMAQEVDLHNRNHSDSDTKYNKLRAFQCHIQESLDGVKAPLLGVEYLVEHPPEEPHHEPAYMCTLCSKRGHPRTIVNHMTCFWHRYNYLLRHFPKACALLTPFRAQNKYREGVSVIMNRLAQRIEGKYGRMRPVHIDKEDYERDKEHILQWIFQSHHHSEKNGCTFEEVVDVDLIESLHKSSEASMKNTSSRSVDRREPSPPVVAAPTNPRFNNFTRPAGRQERRAGSIASLSDISDDEQIRRPPGKTDNRSIKAEMQQKPRFEPYPDRRREPSPFRSRYAFKNSSARKSQEKTRPPNYEYKVKLAEEQRLAAEESAKKTLAYHEKNPEKHPLYPEEWKKFWNRRYKEIQAEGKDPSKHDFKPEWILYWTTRMKELHEEELQVYVAELYRRMCLSPPPARPSPDKSADSRRRSRDRKHSPDLRKRSPDLRKRSPDLRKRSPDFRKRSPDFRKRSPDLRKRSPDWRRKSPDHRRRSPFPRHKSPDHRRDRRAPEFRRSPGRRRSPPHRSPVRMARLRSRSPLSRRRSPARTHIALESVRRSRSPLSQREVQQARNRSPDQHKNVAPSLQTVLISDDELKPDDGLSPWNSDNDMDSVGSAQDAASRTGSAVSRASRQRRARAPLPAPSHAHAHAHDPHELGPAENVVATLRVLVALEDYLGSLGPRVVDLLTEAIKMEKDEPNSSEALLERESAVVLIETTKEKLKGAAQAGLVPGGAVAAVRAAVVRAAATLHEADTRARKKSTQQTANKSSVKPAAVPVAGVGEVDRAQIAQQMAEALIAQGKTDVSSEELAQLVDAVVGMAEAKKREAEKKKVVERAPDKPKPAAKLSGTASALQMLQSAYDENDKKVEKEDAPDAMDGLSDSDLETLLKNFNELSAEEQHSLIAYLKKLEAREPLRVERLRKYVSDAAASAPASEPAGEPPQDAEDGIQPVLVESDDDDYTVEEVFQSATQKVKEDQIRQEMEIVKKSLETKTTSPIEASPANIPNVDIAQNLSSATGLLALVQASLKSTPASTSIPTVSDVVVSNTQPRSFGDLPEAPTPMNDSIKSTNTASLVSQLSSLDNQQQGRMSPFQNQQPGHLGSSQGLNTYQNQAPSLLGPFPNQPGGLLRPPQNHMNFDNRNISNEPYNQGSGPFNQGNNFNQGNENFNQRKDSYNQGNDNYNQGVENYGQANYKPGNSNFNQSNPNFNQSNPNFNQGNPNYNQGNSNFNQGNPNFNQGNSNYNPGSWNQRPNNSILDKRPPLLRGPGPNNFGQNTYGQGPRGNFVGGRGQDNYKPRQQNPNQQFGNYDNQNNNFRGRGGRGHHGGAARGRGRGYY